MKKTKSILILAALLALSAPAWAGQGGEGNNTGCNGVGNANSPCAGSGGPINNGGAGGVGHGGTGIGIGVGIGQGGAGGSVVGSGNSSNTNINANTNQQGQLQGQHQQAISYGSSASSSSGATSGSTSGATSSSGGNVLQGGATSVNVGGDTVTYEAQARNPVASAWAPPIAASTGTCLGSASGGAQTVGFGVSFGATREDEGCSARFDASALNALGLRQAAIARLCQMDGNRKAIEASGGKCPDNGASKPTAELSATQQQSPFIN